MNFLGSLFSSLRRVAAVSSSNNPADDRFSSFVSSPSRLATPPFVVENAGCCSFEREKSSQIIASPNGEEIHFSNVIDFIENHLDMPVADAAQMVDMAKTQAVQFYKQLGMTKKDTDEKHTKFVELANKGKHTKLDIELSQKRLAICIQGRALALKLFIEAHPKWQTNATLASKFARVVVTATSGINACRALNTAIIERFQRYDHEGGNNGNRIPEPATIDMKRAQAFVNFKNNIPCPFYTLSFMKNKGLTILLYGLLGKYKEGEIDTISDRFDNKPFRYCDTTTLDIIFDIPGHTRETRQSAKTLSILIKKVFAKPIEIENDDDDSILNMLQKKKKVVLIKQKPVSPIQKIRRKV
ncbi:hypothetical protein OCU04_012909 [Sclerotinia nivalis]|uniref:Uncharacterized protein n=1 Tax=Sclerotinia nivalis TaxID=352851 RepID=A0A9X0ABY5_9HELO|nr:hypothetical protein OCU04_012909 [Sclerotinia nivalis]